MVYENYGKTLMIKNVDFVDEGNYTCVADGIIGIDIYLKVRGVLPRTYIQENFEC